MSDDEDDLQEDLCSLTEKANIDSLRLSKFLQRAAQVGEQLISNSFLFPTTTKIATYASVSVVNQKTPLLHLLLDTGPPFLRVHPSHVKFLSFTGQR